MLPDKLVEWQMVLDVVEDLAPEFEVSIDVDVGCLTFHVLRVIDTTDGSVQPLHLNPLLILIGLSSPRGAVGHISAEIHSLHQNARFVIDASRLGGFAGIHSSIVVVTGIFITKIFLVQCHVVDPDGFSISRLGIVIRVQWQYPLSTQERRIQS